MGVVFCKIEFTHSSSYCLSSKKIIYVDRFRYEKKCAHLERENNGKCLITVNKTL